MAPLRTCSDCPAPRVGRLKRCPNCRREYDRKRLAEWRAANPERVKQQEQLSSQGRYARNPELFKARAAAYQKANPEKSNAWSRAYRRRHPERHAESTRRVRRNTPPEVVAERARRRQALKMAATVEVVDYATIAERDGWICQLCDEPVDRTLTGRSRMSRSFDHIVPLTKGGEHSNANVQLAHFGCNSAKGNRHDSRSGDSINSP